MAVRLGFIYVLVHPSDSKLVKVGVTTRNPKVRLKEHNTQFDKAAGKIVKDTGEEWVIKKFFAVDDIFNAESAFFHRSPLAEMPYALVDELLILDDKFMNWDWINEGLDIAKSVGVRQDTLKAPIPKQNHKKGAEWIKLQLKGSGLEPLKSFGNGIAKVEFKCSKGHVFKISGYSLCKFPFCPICEPQQFDTYTLRMVEF